MKKLYCILSVLLTFAFAGCGEKKTLHVYCWSDYINPDVIADFEYEYDCRVIIDTFDSNESMYAKLKAGGTGYDIIMPSSYQVRQLAYDGIIEKLDRRLFSNVITNFSHKFDMQILDPELTYSIPYAVTYTGIMYLKDKFSDTPDINSWKIYEKQEIKNRCTMLDDMREVIGIGLMSLGYSLNSTNASEISEAADYIVSIRENVRKFDAESYKLEVSNKSIWFGHGYSSDAFQVILGDGESESRSDIGFILPTEGYTVAWDEFCVMSTAKEKELAYRFIDYMYKPEIAISNMMYIYSPMANTGVFSAAETNVQIKAVLDKIMPAENTLDRGQVLRGFYDTPEVQTLYNMAWDRIRSIKNGN